MSELGNHRARKRFGQNFLVDEGIIDRIIAAVNPKPGDNLVEIGPGQGALTGRLLAANPSLVAIELDRDLVQLLAAHYAHEPGFKLIESDALKVDFSELAGPGPLRVVGNLPYNISTPLIFHLLDYQTVIHDMHFMLQREVVERMAATPGSKTYGRLSIMVQYLCRVDLLFLVPPESFAPAPKVESAIVRLTPRNSRSVSAANPKLFEQLVAMSFQQRRKTLRNNLKPFASRYTLDNLNIDLGRRPETLSVDEFVDLSNQLNAQHA
ncbi:MAG: 16S rRNA (adenine(1518)-N(6)/adenine(1519)-N(6))-dimethyltransferase RsmA [Porticoccaceae bacterium]|nr:16S rRNA (adenine(1518)-N(6)/adenine(1519)-N(6))-dimethyltransferase RsmA [Porticoccaceae bacterium]